MAAINQEGVEGVRKWESLFPANCNQDIWTMPLESETSWKVQKGRTLYISLSDFVSTGLLSPSLSKRIESSTQSTPMTYCPSQHSMVHWLRSSIFPCLSFVCSRRYGNTRPIFTFFNIWRHKSPIITQYHLIPSSAKIYWSITTKH